MKTKAAIGYGSRALLRLKAAGRLAVRCGAAAGGACAFNGLCLPAGSATPRGRSQRRS